MLDHIDSFGDSFQVKRLLAQVSRAHNTRFTEELKNARFFVPTYVFVYNLPDGTLSINNGNTMVWSKSCDIPIKDTFATLIARQHGFPLEHLDRITIMSVMEIDQASVGSRSFWCPAKRTCGPPLLPLEIAQRHPQKGDFRFPTMKLRSRGTTKKPPKKKRRLAVFNGSQ